MKLASCAVIGAACFMINTQLKAQTSEWARVEKSFFELASEGYELKAVVETSSLLSIDSDAWVGTWFFLQKGAMIARCGETGPYRKGRHEVSNVGCQTLVKPR